MEKDIFESRSLDGLALGISISRSNDAADLGFSESDINSAVRKTSTAVLSQGGRVVFGHDWRPEGVMGEVFNLATKYHSDTGKTASDRPLMRNFVPWPNVSTLSQAERARYRDILEIVETQPPSSPSGNIILQGAESLTDMRVQMAKVCNARLCIGGLVSGSTGKCSGVVEEAYQTMMIDKPLYLTGLFGGASQQFIHALKGENTDGLDAFKTPPALAQAFTDMKRTPPEFGIDPSLLPNFGIEKLSEVNFLSVPENEALFQASHLREVIGYVLMGMGRLARHRATSGADFR